MPTSNVTLTPVYVDYSVSGAATWASLGGNQAAYKAAVQQVFDDVSRALYFPGGAKTFNFQIGLNALGGSSGDTTGSLIPGGGVASNDSYINDIVSYTNYRNKLVLLSQNSIQALAFNITNLPVSDPTSQSPWTLNGVLEEIIGLRSITTGLNIGSIGFKPATYTDTNQHGLGAGTNVYEGIFHELTECLGRIENSQIWWWGSAGSRQTSGASSHYFALDQGSAASKIYQLGLLSGGDDFDVISVKTAFEQSLSSGAVSRSSALAGAGFAADWQYLTALGFVLSDDVGGGQDMAGIPINSVAPTVTGSTTQGQTLSISNAGGTWTNSPTFTYQWLRDGSSIGGATSSTYATVSGDIGHNISLSLTGTGASTWLNSTATSSNSVGPIVAIPGSLSVGLIGLRR